jgi:hypothetical protein
MAYTTINKGSSYFNTVLWTGNGGTQSITGVGFQPSLVWGKSRSVNYEQSWIDFVRGGTKYLFSNGTSAESTDANAIQSFNADGITLGSSPYIGNANGATYVGWNWLASNSTVSNTSGTITSTVSANPTAGFSIVSYTGTGANATVGHGLGVAPKMMIIKDRTSGAYNWTVYHVSIGNTRRIILNSTDGQDSADSRWWNNTTPTSTVFTVGIDNGANASGDSFIAYCFADIKGYSKFGSYTGNGSADGTFVYTGFKPAWVMIKQSSGAGEGWEMGDNKRSTYNVITTFLRANSNATESTNTDRQYDFVSNGIKMRGTHGSTNGSGSTYIYAAFAENPFVSSTQIPVTAR